MRCDDKIRTKWNPSRISTRRQSRPEGTVPCLSWKSTSLRNENSTIEQAWKKTTSSMVTYGYLSWRVGGIVYCRGFEFRKGFAPRRCDCLKKTRLYSAVRLCTIFGALREPNRKTIYGFWLESSTQKQRMKTMKLEDKCKTKKQLVILKRSLLQIDREINSKAPSSSYRHIYCIFEATTQTLW